MGDCTIQIRPSFDTPKYMADYFTRKGFDTFLRIKIIDDDCYVTFPNRREAEEFTSAFDGRRINGQTIRAIIWYSPDSDFPEPPSPKRYPPPSPSVPPPLHQPPASSSSTIPIDERRIRSRTLCVKGYPMSKLTDRNLYNDFWKSGYLKQIEINNGIGYLQFDTPEDAEAAIIKNNQLRIGNSVITVEMIPDRALNVPNILVPLVIADKDDRIIRDEKY